MAALTTRLYALLSSGSGVRVEESWPVPLIGISASPAVGS